MTDARRYRVECSCGWESDTYDTPEAAELKRVEVSVNTASAEDKSERWYAQIGQPLPVPRCVARVVTFLEIVDGEHA